MTEISVRRWGLALAVVVVCGSASHAKRLPALPDAAPGHIVIGPYLQPSEQSLSNSLRVVWWSDAPGDGMLHWRHGRDGGDITSEQLPYAGLVRHTAAISGHGSFDYVAEVTVAGQHFTSPRVTASFLPSHDEPFRFAALGDTGAGTQAERNIVEQLAKQHVQMVTLAGDDVYDKGNWSEYLERFYPYYGEFMKTVPIVPALGNHDVGNHVEMGRPFLKAWTPPADWAPPAIVTAPYSINSSRANGTVGPVPSGEAAGRNYSVDAGRCHFVILDSTADATTMREQIVPWALKDMAAARRRGQIWLIPVWHHPPYTHGVYRDNSVQWTDIRTYYVPLLRAAGCRLILNGHDHGYQHMQKFGIDWLVTGGGGAKLYSVQKDYSENDQPPLLGYDDGDHSFTLVDQSADGQTLLVRQIDEFGKQFDAFTLKNKK